MEGAAYFDVEGKDGDWVRVLCEHGDLLIIPAGRNYRMTTTPKVRNSSIINYIFITLFVINNYVLLLELRQNPPVL